MRYLFNNDSSVGSAIIVLLSQEKSISAKKIYYKINQKIDNTVSYLHYSILFHRILSQVDMFDSYFLNDI